MTEKDYNAKQRENKALSKQKNAEQKVEVSDVKKTEEKKENATAEKAEEKKTKKQIQAKKDEASVNGISLPISTKDSVAICKFVKHKSIEKALADLELVSKLKKAIPMKGEIPHRKGKGIMAGRYMTKPVGYFIRLLKSLQANANVAGIENAVIVEAIPNRASRPYGKGGKQRKRTHIHLKVVDKIKLKMKKK
jgi:ribosomal protein L22